MLKSLEVLEVSGAQLTGNLPPEWADATALRAMADKALSTAQRASARATSLAKQVRRSAHNVSRREGSRLSSGANARPLSQAEAHAFLKAKAASVHCAIVQDASNGIPLGLMNLRVLKVTDHNLSGGLPEGYAKLQQLEVIDVSRTSGQIKGVSGLTGPLPLGYAALEKLKVGVEAPRLTVQIIIASAGVLACSVAH
jgi:hypothetical protein